MYTISANITIFLEYNSIYHLFLNSSSKSTHQSVQMVFTKFLAVASRISMSLLIWRQDHAQAQYVHEKHYVAFQHPHWLFSHRRKLGSVYQST